MKAIEELAEMIVRAEDREAPASGKPTVKIAVGLSTSQEENKEVEAIGK